MGGIAMRTNKRQRDGGVGVRPIGASFKRPPRGVAVFCARLWLEYLLFSSSFSTAQPGKRRKKKKKGKSVNTPPTIVGHHSRIANHPRRCGLSQNYCHGERERESANVSSTELSILIRIISLALKGSHFGAHCTAGNENRENSGIEEKNITWRCFWSWAHIVQQRGIGGEEECSSTPPHIHFKSFQF